MIGLGGFTVLALENRFLLFLRGFLRRKSPAAIGSLIDPGRIFADRQRINSAAGLRAVAGIDTNDFRNQRSLKLGSQATFRSG